MKLRAVVPITLLLSTAFSGVAAAQTSPDDELAAATKALRAVTSLHLVEKSTGLKGERTTITSDGTASGDARLSVDDTHDGDLSVLVVGGKDYARGDAKFWRSSGGKKAARIFAGKWVLFPASGAKEFSDIAKALSPAGLAKCLTANLGTLEDAGTATVAGQAAVVIRDRGDKPGTAPGRYYFAKDSNLVLRAVQTGPPHAGKSSAHGSCVDNDKDDQATHAELTITKYNAPVHVTAPAHYLRIPSS